MEARRNSLEVPGDIGMNRHQDSGTTFDSLFILMQDIWSVFVWRAAMVYKSKMGCEKSMCGTQWKKGDQ